MWLLAYNKIVLDLKNKHSNFDDIIIGFIIIMVIAILLILVLNYITVPILKAILTVITIVIGGVYFIGHY